MSTQEHKVNCIYDQPTSLKILLMYEIIISLTSYEIRVLI